MALELVVSEGGLTPRQLEFAEKYTMENYTKSLTLAHRNTSDEIFELEKLTRGQANNNLWKLLRVNRTTASGSVGFASDESPAIQFGLKHEQILKNDSIVMSIVRDKIEERTKRTVVEEVIDCGLFLSPIGLYSASPDVYFCLNDNTLVVMEIKCPYTYRNETLESIRSRMNNTRERYRIPHTAFSVNRHNMPVVKVEKRNNHYRQIQTQMYVTGATLGVYMVHFADMPEIHFVERNIKFMEEMQQRELMRLRCYVNENARAAVMAMETERIRSFNNQLDEKTIRALAADGIYQWSGHTSCYFCRRHFELTDKPLDTILAEHTECDKVGNISAVKGVVHPRFLNIFDRINSFMNSSQHSVCAKDLAKEGLFLNPDDGLVVYYCCGGVRYQHKNECGKIERTTNSIV